MTKNSEKSSLNGNDSFFQGGIVEKFLNQVHMAKEHSAATIAFQAKGVKGISEIQKNM